MIITWICPIETAGFDKKYGIPQNRVLAPWIMALFAEIRKYEEIELHIISPLPNIKKDIHFQDREVSLHFVKSGVPFFRRGYPYWLPLDVLSNYRHINKKINSVIRDINPDIVHLHGTENSYSASILSLTKPCLVSIQGLAHLRLKFEKMNLRLKKQLKNEINIFRTQKHYVIRMKSYEDCISKYNPGAFFYHIPYPINPAAFEFTEENIKSHDLIFAARIVEEKGIEVLIEAMREVKKTRPDITLKIIGICRAAYRRLLLNLIKNYGLLDSIFFQGHITDQKDVFKEIVKAKLFVLPANYDAISGSVLESMALGIPVIGTRVGAFPLVIQDGISGRLVERGNSAELAKTIIELLNDEKTRRSYAHEAKAYANLYRVEPIVKQIVNVYHKILQTADNSR